ncbi:hypothetical protein GCM10010246_04400 [Streptomyces cuspidosporus]|uniref:Uncharacterized protein n=1 Tax=Streptomyces cuspidosporus TaxID=66882 RepID=A0ABP5S7I9_9ACTN
MKEGSAGSTSTSAATALSESLFVVATLTHNGLIRAHRPRAALVLGGVDIGSGMSWTGDALEGAEGVGDGDQGDVVVPVSSGAAFEPVRKTAKGAGTPRPKHPTDPSRGDQIGSEREAAAAAARESADRCRPDVGPMMHHRA